MVRDGLHPAQPGFCEPSPRIPWADFPIEVKTVTQSWMDTPRIAGVHSCSFSGTNVHVIVAEDVVPAPKGSAAAIEGPVMLALSAATPAALSGRACALAAWLCETPALSLASVARSTARTWTGLACADAIVAATPAEAVQLLTKLAARAAEAPAPRRGKVLRSVALAIGEAEFARAPLLAAFGQTLPEGAKGKADWADRLFAALCEAAGLGVASPASAEIVLAVGPEPPAVGKTPVVRALADDLPPVRSVLEAFAALSRHGAAVDARGLLPPGLHENVALPPYPFQHERFWFNDV
ncbi:ketoacyl-synthetase C-terminal extension domain-containing protein [Acuticoccus sp. MNP-M23]|uniref:ketoacyl-synthetase C-terminal extension domain-containing protein n=1 Tax=Acuticoccus sp. MNP-M23 TaxID=3072793 RepID=UPI0035C1CB48